MGNRLLLYAAFENSIAVVGLACRYNIKFLIIKKLFFFLTDKELPEFLRPVVYGLYTNTFGVNLSEALHEDLRCYPSLADFFARPLKNGIRKIDQNSDLVSPCDGTVLHFGTIHTGEIEQVKGILLNLVAHLTLLSL